MKLVIGHNSGFCFGVRRAIDCAVGFANKHTPCATLGPLIHNPQEVERLNAMGIRCISDIREVRDGELLVIRSHGVDPQLICQAESAGICVVDLTCPHVAHIQQLVAGIHSDRRVVIVGESKHPEVKGIAGWAKMPPIILANAAEAQCADLPDKAMVVAQTTIQAELFEDVLQVLKQRIRDLEIHRTICAATGNRQKEAESLSKSADVVVVVGGYNSSNTQKLYKTCKRYCKRTIQIETPDELPAGFIHEDDTVALTAGASTPEWLLEEVRERIQQM